MTDIIVYIRSKWSCCTILCSIAVCALSQNLDNPRFFTLNLQSLNTINQLTNNQLSSFPVPDNDQNFLADASLRFPIKWKGNLKVIGTIGYEREAVFGLYSRNEGEGEDWDFHSVKGSTIFAYDLNPKKKLTARVAWSSSSTRFLSTTRGAQRLTGTILVENQTQKGAFGYGLAVSEGQSTTVLPLLLWQQELSKGYALDIFVPSRILVKKRFSSIHELYGGLRAQSAQYLFEGSLSNAFGDINYRRITIQSVLGYERMITNMIGLDVSVGVNLPYKSGVFNYDQGWKQLHDFKEKMRPQFQAGIFLAIDR